MAYLIKPEHLATIAGKATTLMPGLAEWINKTCPTYGIDTPQEYSHFLAQACHETDHFRTLREYASGNAYEGRTDLGNKQPSDGPRYKGRGIFQTTGRNNYLQLGITKGRATCLSIAQSCSSSPNTPSGAPVSIGRRAT